MNNSEYSHVCTFTKNITLCYQSFKFATEVQLSYCCKEVSNWYVRLLLVIPLDIMSSGKLFTPH